MLYKLRHIPTIGSSIPILSFLDGLRFVKNAKRLLQEGYDKYKGGIYRIPMLDQWLVIITGPTLIEELRKMPEDEVSLPRGLGELIALGHLIGEDHFRDPYTMVVTHTKLSKNMAEYAPLVQDEMFAAFSDLGVGDEWKSVHALKTVIDIIARTSNRVFVGLPLCRNRDFLKLSTNFTIDVTRCSMIINAFPQVLKPIVAWAINVVPQRQKEAMKFVGPMIEERESQRVLLGDQWHDKPNDLLMWLLDYAHGKGYDAKSVVINLLFAEFSAIHTTSMSFTQALYHLAVDPSLAEPLREEVENVLREDGGWTKATISKLRKIDAFLRESQRMNGVSAISLWRKTMKDIQFSDGTRIPAGVFLSAPATSTHDDEANHRNAHLFDPLRFYKSDASPSQSLVTTSVDYIPFGHGKHACPGRFFASCTMKQMLAYIVINFDLKFGPGQEGIRPPNTWIGTTIMPDPRTRLLFRRRKTLDILSPTLTQAFF